MIAVMEHRLNYAGFKKKWKQKWGAGKPVLNLF
jgi:hypothetical protein